MAQVSCRAASSGGEFCPINECLLNKESNNRAAGARSAARAWATGLQAEPAPPLQPLTEFLRAGAQRSFDKPRGDAALRPSVSRELLKRHAKLAPAVSASLHTSEPISGRGELFRPLPAACPPVCQHRGHYAAGPGRGGVFAERAADRCRGLAADRGGAVHPRRRRRSAQVPPGSGAKNVARTYFRYVAACAGYRRRRSRDTASENEQTVSNGQAGLASEA